jgi:hypothetical protein
VIIATELLYSIKQYDWTVLNPINFMMISLLEYALVRAPQSNSIRVWLIKLYSKLGLTSKVTEISNGVEGMQD